MGDHRSESAWDAALRQPGELVRGGPSSFAARLHRWVAEARVDDAARQRARERWLREVAEQEATLPGVLADLAERRAGVSIAVGRRRHHGLIDVIGADFVTLRTGGGTWVLLTMRALGVLRTAPSVEPTVGDRVVATELCLADVLVELALDRERVRLVTTSDDVVAGALRSVGHDVAVVRTDGDPPGSTYVALAAIAEVSTG